MVWMGRLLGFMGLRGFMERVAGVVVGWWARAGGRGRGVGAGVR